jgi:hypothetical protein
MRRYCNYCGIEVDFSKHRGNSHAELWGNSHAELWENSHAELRGNSHAELWGNSHAVLWGNSHAVLWGNSHAVLRENSHAQCKSPYACGILKSITAQCSGRSVGSKPIAPKAYLLSCGVPVKNQYVILYKSVRPNGTSHQTCNVRYDIGKPTVAPDWAPKYKEECGKGLHLSPTIQQARSFNDSGLYLACRVNIKDIAPLPAFAGMPDKIRVRACVPLYKVDKDGNKEASQ